MTSGLASGQLHLNAENYLVAFQVGHRRRSAISRFLEKIEVSESLFYQGTPCWIWMGCKSRTTGYGQFKVDGRRHVNMKVGPHVYAYEYFIEPLQVGQEPHHLCYNRACCSPLHLEARTHQANVTDESGSTLAAKNAAKTECPKGHPYNEENTYIKADGGRVCRICRKERVRKFYEDNPDANRKHCQTYSKKRKESLQNS